MLTTAASPAGSRSRPRCTDVVQLLEATGLDVALSGDRCALMFASPQGITRVLLPASVFVEKARGERDCNGNPLPACSVAKEIVERQKKLYAELERDVEDARRLRREEVQAAALASEHGLDEVACPLDRRSRRAVREDPAPAGMEPPIKDKSLPTISIASTPPEQPNVFRDILTTARDLDRIPAAALQLGALPSTLKPAERDAAVRAAWEVFIATPELNYWQLGQVLGVTASWLRRRFDAFAAEPGAPVLKPNGKL